MKNATHGLALLLLAGTALAGGGGAMTVEEEARALVGTEYTPTNPSYRIAPNLSCTDEGGGILQIDGKLERTWAEGRADCQGRSVLLLNRMIGRQGRYATLRIVDAVVLPPYELDPGPTRLNAWRLLDNEQCEVKGGPSTSFHALVRWGKRKQVDWRTGVKQAWTFDPEAGRIVPLSTRHVVCYWYEP